MTVQTIEVVWLLLGCLGALLKLYVHRLFEGDLRAVKAAEEGAGVIQARINLWFIRLLFFTRLGLTSIVLRGLGLPAPPHEDAGYIATVSVAILSLLLMDAATVVLVWGRRELQLHFLLVALRRRRRRTDTEGYVS